MDGQVLVRILLDFTLGLADLIITDWHRIVPGIGLEHILPGRFSRLDGRLVVRIERTGDGHLIGGIIGIKALQIIPTHNERHLATTLLQDLRHGIGLGRGRQVGIDSRRDTVAAHIVHVLHRIGRIAAAGRAFGDDQVHLGGRRTGEDRIVEELAEARLASARRLLTVA